MTADLVVGTGLVGDAVVQAARLLPGTDLLGEVSVLTEWLDVDRLTKSLDIAASRVRTLEPRPHRLRVFWCAGRAGFGSDAAQCLAEFRSFEVVLRWAEQLGSEYQLEFHLASSAGGLHEGQTVVNSASAAKTPRPYAELKLTQEGALHASSVASRFVYRLSSVYGIPHAGRRLGLVSTLVVNALRHRPTLITAHASTQRDYVAAADVGSFIASDGKTGTAALHQGVHYLVHGRPLSVWALQLALERHMFTRVAVVYTKGKDNFESTTFSLRLRPPLWSTGSVESNLPRIIAAVQGVGRSRG